MMRKVAYFATHWGEGWPSLESLRPYFLGPADKRWIFDDQSCDGSFMVQADSGTPPEIIVNLMIFGAPDLGNLLIYTRANETFYSKGDLSRLGEKVKNIHGQFLPVGLFIPFETAWLGVSEFITTEGALPTSIEWIASRDLPPGALPSGPD